MAYALRTLPVIPTRAFADSLLRACEVGDLIRCRCSTCARRTVRPGLFSPQPKRSRVFVSPADVILTFDQGPAGETRFQKLITDCLPRVANVPVHLSTKCLTVVTVSAAFAPPLTATEAELDAMTGRMDESIADAEQRLAASWFWRQPLS